MAKKQTSTNKNGYKKAWQTEEDHYLELIAQVLIDAKNKDIKPDSELIIDYIYLYLEQVYWIALDYLKNDLKIDIQKTKSRLNKLDELTYKDDGKTLEERVQNLCDKKDYSLGDYEKIQHTEGKTVYNRIIYETVKENGYVAGEYPDGTNCTCEDEDCEQYAGLYRIDELPIAPFHPNCDCEPDYYMYDELTPAQIEELDIKPEEAGGIDE